LEVREPAVLLKRSPIYCFNTAASCSVCSDEPDKDILLSWLIAFPDAPRLRFCNCFSGDELEVNFVNALNKRIPRGPAQITQ